MMPQPTMPSTSIREPNSLLGGGARNEDTRGEQPPIVGNSDSVKQGPMVTGPEPIVENSDPVMVTGPGPNASQDTTQVRQQDSPQTSPSVRRSTRIRKPNVKYSTKDFELSSIRGQIRGRKNRHP